VFWGTEGGILVEILQQGEIVNATLYLQTLQERRRALRDKRPRNEKIILQHDKARSHNFRLCVERIQKNSWELLSHPPYSPDLASSDNSLFGF
jgi:histone-lysine N-methyltransferase SETMAR